MIWQKQMEVGECLAGQRHAWGNPNPKRQRGNSNPKHQRGNPNPKHQQANHNPKGQRGNHRDVRPAFTMVEAVVAAGLLLVVMSFVTSLAYKVDLVWQDTRHRLTATNELSNQLERLTLLSPEELPAALRSLEASELAARTLPRPELTGEIIDDSWGKRLVLRLNWQRRHPARPVQLVAWLPPENATETSQGDSAE